jgi:hypothetical protein
VSTRLHRFAAVGAIALGVGTFGAAVGGIASLDDGVGAIAPASTIESHQNLDVGASQGCRPHRGGMEL